MIKPVTTTIVRYSVCDDARELNGATIAVDEAFIVRYLTFTTMLMSAAGLLPDQI